MVAEALLALAAQGSIHASIRNFSPRTDSDSPVQMRIKGVVTSIVGEGDRSKGIADVFNGEMLMAWLLCFVSIVCRAVCDYMTAVPDFPLMPLLIVSSALWAFSVPLAHVSSRDKAIPLFRPFYGCVEYIALQAVSWTFFAIGVVWNAVVCVDPSGHYAIQAVISSAPLFVITGSIYFQHVADMQSPNSSDSDSHEESREELQKILPLLHSQDLQKKLKNLLDSPPRDPRMPVLTTGKVGLIVSALALSCGFLSLLAASSLESRCHAALVHAIASCVLCIINCGGVHLIWGPYKHPGKYLIFMPFRGGHRFVVLQASGWSCFAVSLALTASFLIRANCLGGGHLVNVLSLVVVGGGFLAVVAQALLFMSVDHVEAPQPGHHATFFEVHAEGAVSVMLFAAATVFMYVYKAVAFDQHDTNAAFSMLIPTFVAGSLVVLAVPLAVVALEKSRRKWHREDDLTNDDDGESSDSLQELKTPQALVLPPLFAAEFLAFALMALIPTMILYVAYYVVHSYLPGVELFLRTSSAFLILAQIVIVLVLMSRTADAYLPQVVLDLRCAVATYPLFLVPMGVPASAFVYPLLRRTIGSVIICANMAVSALVGIPHCTQHAKNGRCALHRLAPFLVHVCRTSVPQDRRRHFRHLHGHDRGRSQCDWMHCIPSPTGLQARGYRRGRVPPTQQLPQTLDRAGNGALLQLPRHRRRGAQNHVGERRQYIMGFHPHGVSAVNRVWDQLSPQWKNAVGCAHRYTMHSANAVFRTPFMRDILLGVGCRSVTRTGILQSIRQGNSVMIVPGGQAELVMSYQGSMKQRLVTYHKGFIRIAIQEQLPLVPVFCFGEQDIQDNLHFERIQRYTAKKFGIALPFMPIGRFYLPLPCRVKQTVVVGAPIPVPPLSEALAREDAPSDTTTTSSRHTAKSKGRSGNQGPAISDEVVNRVAKTYFDALVALIEKYKVEAGYPNLQVVLE